MKNPIKLLLVGDVMLGRRVNESLRDRPPDSPWGDTLPLFERADWRACNLECVITDRGSPWARTPKMFHFRSDACNVAVLKAARMDAVSLANNHSLDYNYPGLAEMLKGLEGAGIAHCGAGMTWEQAACLTVTEAQGVRVGLLSFTDNEPAWEAGPDRPGVFYAPVKKPDERTAALLDRVRYARIQVDLLMVAAHWGGNWGSAPPSEHITLAHDLVQAGADVIFGHSPHVCRGIEIFESGVILYSTGDFIDDYAIDPIDRNDRSFVFELDFDRKEFTNLHLYPTLIRDCQARRADEASARTMLRMMQDLSAPFGSTFTARAGLAEFILDVRQHAGRRHELQTLGR